VGLSQGEDRRRERTAFVKGRFPGTEAQVCTESSKLAPMRGWLRENLTANGVAYERQGADEAALDVPPQVAAHAPDRPDNRARPRGSAAKGDRPNRPKRPGPAGP
jgi:hypothetical protein